MDRLDIYEVIDGVKKNSHRFVTNFYVLPDGMEDWGRRGWDWLSVAHDFALWYRRESGCLRLYFAGELGSAGGALCKIDASAPDPFAVDLIGSTNAVEPLVRIFEGARFKRYEKLLRLSAGTGELTLRLGTPKALPARLVRPGDFPWIREILRSDFDPLADQLPDDRELADAAADSSILVIPSPDRVKGFVCFKLAGVTATIKYWAVHSAFRNEGVGRELLRAYLLHTDGSKRNLLWVKEKNENALKRYLHYGYKADGMADQILAAKFQPQDERALGEIR